MIETEPTNRNEQQNQPEAEAEAEAVFLAVLASVPSTRARTNPSPRL
jgi:hypothetical protein